MASVVSSWYERSDGSGGVYLYQTTREWVDMSKLTDAQREQVEKAIVRHNRLKKAQAEETKYREQAGRRRGLFGISTSV